MSIWDDLANYRRPSRPALPEVPEPGTPAGAPGNTLELGPRMLPMAADATPLLDSGLHMVQPQDVGELRWDSRFRSRLALKTGIGLRDFPAVLFPTIPLGNFEVEDFYPQDQLRSGVTETTSGGAALGQHVLLNPAGGKILIIVDRLFVSVSVADVPQLRYGNAALGGSSSNTAFDDTRVGTGINADRLTTQTGAAVGGGVGGIFEFYRLPANTVIAPFKVEGPFLLVPGVSLSINQAAVGVETLTVVWKWREKVAYFA